MFTFIFRFGRFEVFPIPFYLSSPFLVRFDRSVDVIDEGEGAVEAHKAQHGEEGVGHDGHVAEVEGQLQIAAHVGAMEEVVERVGEHEQSRGAAIVQRRPPPTMILQNKGHLKKFQIH